MKRAIILLIAIISIFLLSCCNEPDSIIEVEKSPSPKTQPTMYPATPPPTRIPAPMPQPIGITKPEAPTFSIEGGLYSREENILVEIYKPEGEDKGKIYYTLNGTKPNKNSEEYKEPLEVLKKTGNLKVLIAIFITDEGAESDMTSACYEHIVQFEDKAIENILMDYFKPEDNQLRYHMLGQITDFMVFGDFVVINNSKKFTEELKYEVKKQTSEYDTAKVTKRGDIESLKDLKMMYRLTTLIVDYNKVRELPESSDTIIDMIDLSDNYITDISWVGEQTGANIVILDNNNITDVSCIGGMNYNSYQYLSLSNNPIEVFPDLSICHSLTSVWLDNTGLSEWPLLPSWATFVTLDLSHNNIKTIEDPTLQLTIHNLFLNNNQITDISNLPKLENNQIKYQDFLATVDATGKCINLDLSNNNIKDISPLLKLKQTEVLIIKNNSESLDMNIINQLTWMSNVIID